ncbi:pyridoxamine 5'-phosphate oxidase [Frondihabitans australicus]|uniref:Pyridoxamine 5'-phosphate oxidase n=2 Tax=Frondihabitans australicus TaxID=386892 RepID=A0A495IJ32_9MICO|nr:pyridoxamine 5'-phosphate oxidase [Frondihabitans australicus]
MPDEAWALLQAWLPSNDAPDRPLMTLSTITPAGRPDARAVLLTEYDEQGLYFHTDSGSAKVAQLAAEPHVALTLLWPELPRQLVVRGVAAIAPPDESAWAYRARSPYLQQLAWQNTPAFAELPDSVRREQWAEFAAAHPDGFEQPDTWFGVVVRPTELTFWTPGVGTASRRLRFTRSADTGGWQSRLLSG